MKKILYISVCMMHVIMFNDILSMQLLQKMLKNLNFEQQTEAFYFYSCNHNVAMVEHLIRVESDDYHNARSQLLKLYNKDSECLFDPFECIKIYQNIKKDEFIVKAFEENNILACKIALASGASVNACSTSGKSLLHYALHNNSEEAVQLLLSHPHVSVSQKDILYHLSFFARRRSLFQQLLCRPDMNVNILDDNSRSLLHYAVLFEFFDMIIPLLEHANIQVNIRDNQQKTPLHYAVRQNCSDIVIYLLIHKDIDCNVRDIDGRTPYDIAMQCKTNFRPSFLQALLKNYTRQ